MAIQPIVMMGDPILRTVASEVDAFDDEGLKALARCAKGKRKVVERPASDDQDTESVLPEKPAGSGNASTRATKTRKATSSKANGRKA